MKNLGLHFFFSATAYNSHMVMYDTASYDKATALDSALEALNFEMLPLSVHNNRFVVAAKFPNTGDADLDRTNFEDAWKVVRQEVREKHGF